MCDIARFNCAAYSDHGVQHDRFYCAACSDLCISPQFRKKHPEINWKRLVELRNVIAYEYGETLTNRIWLAATDGLDELIKTLNGLLDEEE